MKPKAVFFDAGNTLVWVDHNLLAAAGGGLCAQAVAEADRQLRPTLDARMRARDANLTDIFDAYHGGMLRGAGLPEQKVAAALERLKRAERLFSTWRRANPEVRPAVRALQSAGLRVAVISNADGRVADLLEACTLADLFEFIMDSHIEGIEKPDVRLFHRACEKMGVAPEESAYVGDIPFIDVDGSRSAGMIPILYDPLDAFPSWTESLRARDLRDLPRLLEVE